MNIIRFAGYKCKADILSYPNGRPAIELISVGRIYNGEPIAVATVNIPEITLSPKEVIIKNYSENEGVLDALVKAGIISDPIRWIQTGFAACPVCELLS